MNEWTTTLNEYPSVRKGEPKDIQRLKVKINENKQVYEWQTSDIVKDKAWVGNSPSDPGWHRR